MSAPRALPAAGSRPTMPPMDRRSDYRAQRERMTRQAPCLAEILPLDPVPAIPRREPERLLAALRRELATRNEEMLVVGIGDGAALELIAQDPVARAKRVNLLAILPEESADLARAVSSGAMAAFLAMPRASLHLVRSAEECRGIVPRFFGSHGEIARISGLGILADHPLDPAAETHRARWLPDLRKTLAERLDCLGNDVYDTFMGAKHALMHGRALHERPRLGDILGAGKGRSAICIASGPSARPHFDRLREIQREHILICADSILGGLLDAGIEPDFVCMVERTDDMHKLIDGAAGRCRTTMVALPVVHPSSVAPFGDRVLWYWNADDLYPWLDPAHPRGNTGRSAGVATAAVAAALGVETAWLVGHDLSYHDGRSHADGTASYATEQQALVTAALARNHPNYYYRQFTVPRNGGGTVETTGVWEIFRSDLEAIIQGNPGIRFRNPNIGAGVGAAIAHALPGDLPSPTGAAIAKPAPTRAWDEAGWTAYRTRVLRLREDVAAMRSTCQAMQAELAALHPLAATPEEGMRLAERLDLTRMVSDGNRALVAYVFRAALRNLTLRLHYNTFVRTEAERTWNQIQVLRLYAATMPALIDRLRPELEQALEAFA